jgi:hypothetical protein
LLIKASRSLSGKMVMALGLGVVVAGRGEGIKRRKMRGRRARIRSIVWCVVQKTPTYQGPLLGVLYSDLACSSPKA